MPSQPILIEAEMILQAAPLFRSKEALAKHLGIGLVTLYKNLRRLGIVSLPLLPNPRNKGNKAWNHGLTKDTDDRLAKMSENKKGTKNPQHGSEPWNKGLTKNTDSRLMVVAYKNTGTTHSATTRLKMAASARQRTKHGMQGKKHSDATRTKLSVSTLRQLAEGRVVQTRTKPHMAVRDLLENLKINYREEAPVGVFSVDFMVEDRLVIEVNGDYWHSNPKFYPDGPKTKSQKINHLRDLKKMKTIRAHGLKVVVVWEDEVNDGSYADKIRQVIRSIDSDGAPSRSPKGPGSGNEVACS